MYVFGSRDLSHGVLVRLIPLFMVESDAGAERIGRGFSAGEDRLGCGCSPCEL